MGEGRSERSIITVIQKRESYERERAREREAE